MQLAISGEKMQYEGSYVPLGKTGLRVSKIAFGCGFRGVSNVKDAVNTISKAMDAGINFFDCADVYRLRGGAHAEEALGAALRGRRPQTIVTTKFGALRDPADRAGACLGASRRNMIRSVENSLKRLETDYIDVLFLHLPDEETALEETGRAFEQLCRDGKIRYAGLCNHKAWQIATLQANQEKCFYTPISVIQNPYNLLNRLAEEELLPMAAYEGIGVMTYSPLAAGLLSGDFAKGRPVPEKSTWGHEPLYVEYIKSVFCGRASEIADAVDDMAQRYGVSSAAVATAWVLHNDAVTCVIAGADCVEELKDSMEAATLLLDAEDFAALDRLSCGMREGLTLPEVRRRVLALRDRANTGD